MPSVLKSLVVLACLVPLAGCSLFGGDDEEAIVEDTEIVATENKVPVQSVAKVEIGRTRDGYLISAFGTAPGLGYGAPELRVRRGGQPAADGFVEFDFIAARPANADDLPPGTTRARAIRADYAVVTQQLRGIAGIRVLALSGGAQVAIGTAPAPTPSN